MLSTGEEAINQILTLKPDIILMDFVLPGMDGLATTKEVMAKYPTSIIIVSAILHRDNIENTFSALDVGAMALIEKPDGSASTKGIQQGRELVETLEQIAKAKLFKHRRLPVSKRTLDPAINKDIKYIMIGSSTGGPDALQKLFKYFFNRFNRHCGSES